MNNIIQIENIKLYRDNSLNDTLTEKFKALFPSYPMMIATLIALILVILILWFLLHKPIKKAMKERQDFIQNNIDQAKATNDLSQIKLKEANERLAQAHLDANAIVKEAKLHGEHVIAQYTEKAQAESKRITEKARFEISKEREMLIEESKNNIAKAAIEISRQIIKKEVSKQSQDKIINDFLEDKKEEIE